MVEHIGLKRRLRQQEVVADLGQQALATENLDQLMHDACVAIATTLDNDYCKVLELLPGGDAVFLRQGVGWRDGLVGSATVPTERDSQAGYTLISEEPVIVDDLRTEERFSGPELLSNHHVISGISVIIGSIEAPWGVLGTHTTSQRQFDEYDAAFVQSVANVLASAIERTQREQALERAQQRTELALTATNATVWEWEPDIDRVTTHPDPHGLFEQPVHSRDDFLEVIHPEDRAEVRHALHEAKTSGTSYNVEYRYIIENTVKWAEDEGEVVDRDGHIIGVAHDITERKQREQELGRFKRAVEASGHAIYMTDAEGVITYVNPAFEEITGYSASDAIGETPYLLQSGEHDETYYRKLWETVRSGHVWEEEITDRRKDGSLYYAQQTIAPVTDRNGEIDRFVAVQHDITEEKEQQRALRESERRYRTLVDHFPHGAVALFDHDLRFTAAGGDLLDELGAGNPVGERIVDRYPADLIDDIEPHFRATLNGEKREFEIEYLDRFLLARTLPIRSEEELYGGMLVFLDVTEERESQRRLEESHQRLEEFASAVSHDLREPLGTMAGYLQLLERRYEEELDEDAEEFIDFAVNGATRMREMIDGLVTTYARVDEQSDPAERVDLSAVLNDVLLDLSKKIEASNADITADSLPQVEGRRGQIRQLLMNLVDNGIKYAGDGTPRIHVTAEQDGELWIISVSDEGIGIDPDATEEIFDVFHRLHDSEEYPGTGIGLALCERIVERHGGDIWVESEPDNGSTFLFTLPA